MPTVKASAAVSHVGRVRSNNQDSGYAGRRLFLVADGMGGHAGGDVASAIATRRIAEADVTLDDSGASRRHAEVQWDGSRARVRDLGSTNGTQLDGAAVKESILEPDSVITIGRSRIVFRVLAQAAGGAGEPRRAAPATQRHDMGGFWGAGE